MKKDNNLVVQLANFKGIFFGLLVTSSIGYAKNHAAQLGSSPVKEVIKAMTLEEKESLVVGTGLRMAGNDAPIIGEADGRVVHNNLRVLRSRQGILHQEAVFPEKRL